MNTEDLIAAIESGKLNDAREMVDTILMSKVGFALTEKRKTLGDSLVGNVQEASDDEEYEKFFRQAMKKFGISSPDELETDEKKKEFFDYIDKNYKAKNESVTESINPKHIDPKGYYIVYTHSGHRGMKPIKTITGPYSSEEEGFYDHGEDVDDAHTGEELIRLLKKGHYRDYKLEPA